MHGRVLIDTNILLLLVVGSIDRASVSRYRRTAQFVADDFDLLQRSLLPYERIVTTPTVLTEASNLLGNDFHEAASPTFIRLCTPFLELTRPKEDVFAVDSFSRLGFSDASILSVLDAETTILTDDVHLYLQALHDEHSAINFNHLRTRYE